MKNNRNWSSRALLSAIFAMLSIVTISINARSQTAAPAPAAPDYSKVVIKTTKITNNFYELEGQGGNIGILTGPDGILVVDTEFAPLTGKIVAAIKQVSTAPIRFVINTHVHGDHTGGDENFAKLGATIFAREELRERLAHPAPGANGAPGTPAPQGALPIVTYNAPIKFHMDGEEADAIPILHAHTDGDTMVRFHVANVIMSGDFYRSAGYPNIDRVNGGSLNGMLDGLAILISIAGPNTRIIPGHGVPVDRAAVTAHRDMILAIRERVAKLLEQGKTADEVLAAHVTSDYDAKVPVAADNGEKYADRFVGQLYAELKAAK
jgi:cyclase